MEQTPAPLRPLRFRLWDGERMHYPPFDNLVFSFEDGGEVWAFVGIGGVDRWDKPVVFLLSTGLRDAEGREVYEGDAVEREWGGRTARATVRHGDYVMRLYSGAGREDWQMYGWHLVNDDGTTAPLRRTPEGSIGDRVVGHVYEPAPVAR